MYRASQSERAECPTAVQDCLNNTFSFIIYNIILFSLCIIWNMDRDFSILGIAPGKVSPPSPIKKTQHFTKNAVAVSKNIIRREGRDCFFDEKL